MKPDPFKLAKHRLWLGITNVGLWVLAACAGLWWLIMTRAGASSPQLFLVIGVGAIAVQAVLDFIGGAVLMPEPRPTLVAILPGWSRGLIGHLLVMATVVLPVLSRNAVYAADRAAASSGLDPRAWITRFPELVGEDGSPNVAVQTIFYPIPSAKMRLNRLRHPSTGFVPGNLARSNLYYSWATFTLLGRAVHCNVGRPSLWVFPPSA